MTGTWKGYLYGDGGDLMFLADIEYKNGGVFVTIKWAPDSNGNTREDSSFNGDWTGGKMDVVGSGRITIDSWWQLNGRQYGAGEFIWPSGEKPRILLVRP